jgi:hypothetical protein
MTTEAKVPANEAELKDLLIKSVQQGNRKAKHSPKSKAVYAGKDKNGRGGGKLPVPPPKPEQQAASASDKPFADPKKDGIPVELQVQNRKPLTPEQKAKVDAALAKATAPAKAQADLRAAQKATAKEKARVRIEKLKAKKSGEAKKLPPTGKAALKVIHGGKADKPKPAVKAKTTNGKTKTAIVGDLLRRKDGCTTADILKATGWPSVSVPQQAKAVGLKLRKEKKPGEVTRYYGS